MCLPNDQVKLFFMEQAFEKYVVEITINRHSYACFFNKTDFERILFTKNPVFFTRRFVQSAKDQEDNRTVFCSKEADLVVKPRINLIGIDLSKLDSFKEKVKLDICRQHLQELYVFHQLKHGA